MTSEEKQKVIQIASSEEADWNAVTKICEEKYKLKTGKAVDAVRGLDDRMNVNRFVRNQIAKEVDGIQEEVELFAAGDVSKDRKEVLELLNYIRFEPASEKLYSNGMRDKGRGAVKLVHFLMHRKAQEARLIEAEVVALRLYSTSAFKFMNDPLRDDLRHNEDKPCPLAVTTYYASSGAKKLRSQQLHMAGINRVTILWRGMKDLEIADNFMLEGGTELGFMSTTTDLEVAVRYSLSQNSLLFKIVSPDFMSMGADLQWVSAFPAESEILYPPLTYLKPTGRTENINVIIKDQKRSFVVVEVQPTLS
jgi:hypothetical protein